MLLAAGVLPSEPTPREGPDFAFVVTIVFKIVWWDAASWLFAGFFRAMLVFKRQPRETRFLQDLSVRVIYVAHAIVANVFGMPVGGCWPPPALSPLCSASPFKAPWATSSQASCSISRNPIIPATGSSSTAAHKDAWLRRTGARRIFSHPTTALRSYRKARLINASQPMRAHSPTIIIRLEPTVTASGGRVALQAALLSCNRILQTLAPTVAVRMRNHEFGGDQFI